LKINLKKDLTEYRYFKREEKISIVGINAPDGAKVLISGLQRQGKKSKR